MDSRHNALKRRRNRHRARIVYAGRPTMRFSMLVHPIFGTRLRSGVHLPMAPTTYPQLRGMTREDFRPLFRLMGWEYVEGWCLAMFRSEFCDKVGVNMLPEDLVGV